ncbi:MAG TPA: hypothetical protein DCS63_04375 [Elusimicrobia bacterium]|nr:hypothetical protein [Elusimicrobiota bacterium]
MKGINILTVAFAVLAAGSIARAEEVNIDFDGKQGSPLFAQFAVQEPYIPGPGEGAVMPARTAPEFTRRQVLEMDKSIGSAIDYVNAHGQGAYLAQGFTCLRQNGTPEQKYLFVYQAAGTTYSLPANCVMQNKGVCTWIFDTVCKTVTYMACAIMADGSKECHEEAREDCSVVKKCLFPEE